MENVIAIDPGERTGWAAGIVGDGGSLEVVKQGVTPLKDFALALARQADKYDVIVYETWRLYPSMAKRLVGNDMQPAQLVGMIRLVAWLNPRIKLVSQGANIKNVADRTMSDDLRERIAQSSEEHDKDALRHLHYYAWRKTTEVD